MPKLPRISAKDLVRVFKKIGFEIKYTDSPKITRSMRIALDDLNLDHLFIIIPHNDSFKLDAKIYCLGIERIFEVPAFLFR